MTGEALRQHQRIAADDDLVLEFPECSKGIGSVIRSLDSAELIAGVKLQPLTIWPDDRGYFLEVQRLGHGLAADFPLEQTQISAALSYPGAIKAFHYHLRQTDCWTVAKGMLQVALVDLRAGSRTFGLKNTLYIGVQRPWQLLIPPGVGHGYKVIGLEPALLVYMTDQFYNSADEGRIAYNHPDIDYDWEVQHK